MLLVSLRRDRTLPDCISLDGPFGRLRTGLLSRWGRLGPGYKPRPETSFIHRYRRCSGIDRNTLGRPECWSGSLRAGLTRCYRIALTAHRRTRRSRLRDRLPLPSRRVIRHRRMHRRGWWVPALWILTARRHLVSDRLPESVDDERVGFIPGLDR